MNFLSIIRTAGQASVLAACLTSALASSPAFAGEDLYGWRGFYVGATGSYSFINQNITFTRPTAASGSASLDGIGGTGMVGYRIPIWTEKLRMGFEFDGTVGDNHGGFNKYRFGADYLVTGRATLGWHVHPDLLWFGTAGVGWLGINSASAATTSFVGTTGSGSTLVDRRSAKTVVGGVIGTGLEWDMGRAFHLRGDYMFGSYEGHRADTAVSDKSISSNSHQLRLGIVVSLQNPYDEPHSISGRGGDIDHDRYTRGPMK
jgi:hypothetical protein